MQAINEEENSHHRHEGVYVGHVVRIEYVWTMH
jgi:hypothetical protein